MHVWLFFKASAEKLPTINSPIVWSLRFEDALVNVSPIKAGLKGIDAKELRNGVYVHRDANWLSPISKASVT